MTLEGERAKKIECKHGAKKGTNKPNRKKIQMKFRLNGTKRASSLECVATVKCSTSPTAASKCGECFIF